jgi:sialate O-acetylesterase
MKRPLILLPALFALITLRAGEVKLPAVFSGHAILQRDTAVPVWGWADPGEEVVVEFAGQKRTTMADANGKWMVKLDPLAASAEPREMRIGERLVRDVLVGDVWLCTGQSNMGFWLRDATDGKREVAEAQHPTIRLMQVAQHASLEPAADVKAQWEPCSPKSVETFSAVSYFFGRELQRKLKMPIGLLRSSLGGTPAESWTRLAALRTLPHLARRADKEIEEISRQETDNRRFVVERAAWEERHGVKPPPIADSARGWGAPELDVADWKPVTLPLRWSQAGAKSGGVFWLRKEFSIPESAAGKRLAIALGGVSEQYDTIFFNGTEIGHGLDIAPDFYLKARNYTVPEKLVKAGRAVVALRVVTATPNAGLSLRGRALFPTLSNATDDIWLMKTESTFAPLPADAHRTRPRPNKASFNNVSGALYNGMIAPLIPFAVKGVIWYQGESNVPRATEYRDLLTTMICDWRAQWGQGAFPFLIQQLVNFGEPWTDPNAPANWAVLREAQAQVAAELPSIGMSVGIDIGDMMIHPPNKRDIGRRLALVALEKAYLQPVESSGPRYDSMKIEGATLRISFTHAAGLTSKGGAPKNFAIAGAGKLFVSADARIEGDTIIVSSPQVSEPVAVRYAWGDNPANCNVYNASDLPAAPFRTDDWPLPVK